MLPAEHTADLGQRGLRQFLDDVHRDLARIGNLPRVGLLLQLPWLQSELLGNRAQYRSRVSLASLHPATGASVSAAPSPVLILWPVTDE